MSMIPPFSTLVQQQPRQQEQQQHLTSLNPSPAAYMAGPPSAQSLSLPQHGAPTGVDLAALSGISPQQLAAIAHLFQTGQLPIPPPLPLASQNGATTAPTAPLQPSQAVVALSGSANSLKQSTAGDMVMDKEEGEVEDGEVEDTAQTRGFLHTPPKGPANHSRSPRPPPASAPNGQRASQQTQKTQMQRPAVPSRKTSNSAKSATSILQLNGYQKSASRSDKDASVKAFLLEMHHAGYGFDLLSKEVSDTSALLRLYQHLSIPLSPSSRTVASPAQHISPTLPVKQERKASIAKKPIPAKASTPLDRSEYLAKLKAAKNKKAESAAPATLPQAGPPSLSASLQTTKSTIPPQRAEPKSGTPSNAALEVKKKNELIKQKLEALKAQQAAKQIAQKTSQAATALSGSASTTNNTIQPAQQVDGVTRPGLGHGLVEAAAKAAIEGTSMSQLQGGSGIRSPTATIPLPPPPNSTHQSSASPTLNRPHGLPGLFSTAPSIFQASSAVPSWTPNHKQHMHQLAEPGSRLPNVGQSPAHTPVSISSSRQRPSGTEVPQPNGTRSHIAPTGQGGTTEPFIIQDSDDESDDDIVVEEGQRTPFVHGNGAISQHPGPIKNFPARSGFPNGIQSSSPGTPGTPEIAYKRKLEEIEETKKELDELVKRQKLGRAKPRATENDRATPSLSTSGIATPVPQVPAASIIPAVSVIDGGSRAQDASTAVTTIPLLTGSPAGDASRRGEVEALRLRMTAAQNTLRSGGVLLNSNAKTAAKTTGSSASTRNPGTAAEPAPLKSAMLSGYFDEGDGTPGESGEVIDLQTSDEDEAMYATHDAAGGTVGAQVAIANISSVAEDPTAISDTAHAATGQLSADDGSEDDDEIFYQAEHIHTIPNGQNQISLHHGITPTGQHEEVVGDEAVDEDDDLDDVYTQPAEQHSVVSAAVPAVPAVPPYELSSDEDIDTGDAEQDDSDDAMDTSDDSETSTEDDQVESDTGQTAALHAEESTPDASQSGTHESTDEPAGTVEQHMEAEDLAPELQPFEEELAVPHEEPLKMRAFVPYDSPLARLKDFRYHPEFLARVPGGFKSLSYSHKIDPIKTVCPYESASGECHDKTCPHQHFRSMGLSDNDLLRSMGAENIPAQTADETERWKTGLNGVVQELRGSNQGKDVLTIARRIAEFRREFRGDASKILMLD